MERLQEEVARLEEIDQELSGIRAKTERLEAEATHLRLGHDEAHKDAKRLRGERAHLQQDPHEVTLQAEEAESTVRVANTRLEMVGGRSSLSWVFHWVQSLFMIAS